MIPTPTGWPRLSLAIYYNDASSAIDWLREAFDFDVRLRVQGENGRILHSELTFGEAVLMVAQAGGRPDRPLWPIGSSPLDIGGRNTQSAMLYVDDVDAHCERARAAGAAIVDEPAVHDYGADYWADRSYGAVDPEGHLWWFTQRLRG